MMWAMMQLLGPGQPKQAHEMAHCKSYNKFVANLEIILHRGLIQIPVQMMVNTGILYQMGHLVHT